ncbi:uncharacterized protein BP5553_03822 [Venustampulla echinocandica]|uniref:Glycosyltransferase family 92 protein n=1 Tax=Venustampulla echinocandica TaxID=2656787 RepID=A0A370TVB1_9HELO|nr:uncharacterized protein BP5553_03822 [Venustampulla echinocandica]RDL39482.1 hypothetical protein BP5553_03822 [Venustampulla echinocandica]
MRSIATSIQSLNWRLILSATVCFMVFYLLVTDDHSRSQTPNPITPPEEAPQEQPATQKSPSVLGEYDGRVDDPYRINEPNPVLGVDYDSPLDAIPDRTRPGGEPAEVGDQKPDEETSSSSQPEVQPPDTQPSTPAIASETEDENYVAICMAVKNQRKDLPEFLIHHYHHLGIRNFYIMDDASDPPLSEIPDAELGVPRETITFEMQDESTRGTSHSQQLDIYMRCIENYGANHTWMAFLDADEFLQMTGNQTLTDMLSELEQDKSIGSLGVNWRMHTSSGLLTRPESARKGFIDCIWDDLKGQGANSFNRHVKSIVRVSHAVRPANPHLWVLKDGSRTVGEHGDTIDSEAYRTPITRDRIALHHYAGKSREEYEEKMQRGNAMDDPKGEEFWKAVEKDLPHMRCTEMTEYYP